MLEVNNKNIFKRYYKTVNELYEFESKTKSYIGLNINYFKYLDLKKNYNKYNLFTKNKVEDLIAEDRLKRKAIFEYSLNKGIIYVNYDFYGFAFNKQILSFYVNDNYIKITYKDLNTLETKTVEYYNAKIKVENMKYHYLSEVPESFSVYNYVDDICGFSHLRKIYKENIWIHE